MGILRKIARFASGLLFSLCLSLLLLTILASSLTKYENVKMIFTDVYVNALKGQMGDQQIEQTYNNMSIYCQQNEKIDFPFMNQNMTLSCSDIVGTNSTHFLYLLAGKVVDVFYYKDYGCDFIKCLQEMFSEKILSTPEKAMALLSSTSNKFFDKIFLPMALATVFTGLLLLASIETWPGRFKTVGIEFLFIGIFYFLAPYLEGFIFKLLPPQASVAEGIYETVFKMTSHVLLIFFVIGVVFIALWVLSKFLMKKKKKKSK